MLILEIITSIDNMGEFGSSDDRDAGFHDVFYSFKDERDSSHIDLYFCSDYNRGLYLNSRHHTFNLKVSLKRSIHLLYLQNYDQIHLVHAQGQSFRSPPHTILMHILLAHIYQSHSLPFQA